jgi:hypothetical protein
MMSWFVNKRLVIVCFWFIAAISFVSASNKPPGFPDPKNISVPDLEAFARDRNANSGFVEPKQAASEFMRTLFSVKHDLLRDTRFK